jgi:hypothetical protein
MVHICQRGWGGEGNSEQNGASSAVVPTNHGSSFRGFSIADVYVECKYCTNTLWIFYKQENKESALLLRRVCGSGNILIKTAFEMSVFD